MMGSSRASPSERAHFRAVAEANTPLPQDRPPASLEEMFRRLDAIRLSLGAAALPGVAGEDESELASHLRYLERRTERQSRGAERT